MQLDRVDVLWLGYRLVGDGCLQIGTELSVLLVGLFLLGGLHLLSLVLLDLLGLFTRLFDDFLRLKFWQSI